MAIINTPLLGLPYAGADTDETYAVLAGLFVKDGKKLTLPEIVEKYTPTVGTVHIKAADWTAADGTEDAYDAKIKINGVEAESVILIYPLSSADTEKAKRLGIRAKTLSGSANDDTFVIVRATGGAPTVADGISLVYIAFRGYPVWNEGLTPPAMPYATVIGVDPYIATEEGDRDDIAASQRLVTEAVTALRSSLSTLFTGLADTNKALELRLKSADLQTKLDEYRAAKGLIDKTVSDLVNYYTKSQTLTKDEINALVSAIPKFNIEVVTSLPASNISETTVYLVKSGDDDTNLYTEYIRANGAWERLGTQTVDLTGYATEAWVNDILAAYAKIVDMEAYVTEALNGYLTKEEADETYAKPSDIPTVPQTLPNPYALNLLGKTYNGASAVSLTVDELIAAIKTASGGVIAWVGDDNNIYLSGNLLAGNYKAYYEVDGEYIEIGDLTLAEEETPEPEPTTYTVTFVADGVTVAEVEYAVGDTIEEPTVPAKDGYTGVWETYDISSGGNLTVNAVYTAIEIEPTAPYDFAQNFTVGRFKSDGTIDATTTAATACTDYIGPIKVNDEILIKGFGAMGDYNSAWYNASKSIYDSGKPNAYSGSAMSYAYDSASGVVTIKKVTDNQGYSYLRVGGKLTGTTADVVVNIKRDGEYLTE